MPHQSLFVWSDYDLKINYGWPYVIEMALYLYIWRNWLYHVSITVYIFSLKVLNLEYLN